MKKVDRYEFSLLYIKNKWNNLLEKKNREAMLNRAKENWENDKQIKRLTELAWISKNIKETIAKLKNENKEFWTLFYII